jgi:hypothetical protein
MVRGWPGAREAGDRRPAWRRGFGLPPPCGDTSLTSYAAPPAGDRGRREFDDQERAPSSGRLRPKNGGRSRLRQGHPTLRVSSVGDG